MQKGYIAHPVLSRDMVAEWEKDFERVTKIQLINPFTDVEKELEKHLVNSEAGDYTSVDPTHLINVDLQAICQASFVVAFVTGQRSYGTIMEIVYATIMNKPVYIICTNGHETHPWLVYHAEKIFTTPEEFTTYMFKKYLEVDYDLD
jgi:nucleoside 2-deoxyribosyltransferase